MKKQKIYIIPTKFGMIYIVCIVVILLVGAAYANNLVNLLAFFMLSIAFIGMVQTHNNLKFVRVQLCHVDPGFAGTQIILHTVLENHANDPRFGIDSRIKELKLSHDYENILPLPGHATLKLKGAYTVEKRGQYRLKRVKISTVYPLGLFYAWNWLPIDAGYFVYPKIDGVLPLPPPKIELTESSRARSMGGDDFSGHRKYQGGDSSRHIDWKAYARGRPLMIKEFKEGAPHALLLDWHSLSMADPEKKLSQLAMWIDLARQRQIPYALQLPGIFIPPSLGPHHDQVCLEKLAIYGIEGGEKHDHQTA